MSSGGLPPPRPDQQGEPTPRIPVPGARTTPIVNKPGTVVIVQQGGVSGLTSAQVTGAGSQFPTAFFTFSAAGRIWGAILSFAADTNGAYAAASQRLYAQIKTQTSGVVLATVELCVSAPSQAVSNGCEVSFPGLAVASGEKLQLDVNNNTTIGGGNGIMSASAVVSYSIP